jgi:hypothetical protein
VCLRAQAWNVRPANFGTGARRWMPIVFSTSTRNAGFDSDQFATGANGVPSRPVSVGRAITRSRSVMPSLARSFARACVLISAMCTPCGHTCVQIPQPEQ